MKFLIEVSGTKYNPLIIKIIRIKSLFIRIHNVYSLIKKIVPVISIQIRQ